MNVSNEVGFRSLVSGNFHVGYAAGAIVALGVVFIFGGQLWAGILLIVLGTGIFVDTWANGFFH